MKSRSGFEGLTAAQRDIVSYWQSTTRDGALPARGDIDPGKLRAHLGSISLIEVDLSGEARFRLVGTRLQPLLGGDARGQSLSSLSADVSSLWSRDLERTINKQTVTGGVTERADDRHAWLRLPLDPGTNGLGLILCHDVFLKQKTEHISPFSSLFPPIFPRLAA